MVFHRHLRRLTCTVFFCAIQQNQFRNYSIFAVTNILLFFYLTLRFLHLHKNDLNISTKLLFSNNLGYMHDNKTACMLALL